MERLEKIIACFKEVKFEPKLDDFQDKLVIQKAVCLLQLMGMKTGYSFSLYVRGPYSPELTKDLYSHREAIEKLRSGCSLSTNEQQKVLKVYELSDNFDPKLLEIMATYSFIRKQLGMNGKDSVIHLKKLKPFPEAQIAVGVSRAKGLFPPSEKEIAEMKAEFEAWDDAANSDAKY
ncbi:MAG: hypothetical protein NT157_06020 [Candidatus Micrarchaeota archaeon]|nr:hypothetical protein [Candidatus Micrarchaeota archaeon]